ncbi:response regulator [Kushneria aurantia]|uniref:histidine kinase n=1 Tax=Kushneria aurantia TaxID=504092 RepID=A0ABV6G071_9GAMM|nr:response regulator [Kushneria aurantia]
MDPRSSPQRIVKIRRAYNRWVGDETLEDYALRFTARSFRKWREACIANTALGGISFLALEAIGAVLMVRYGFATAATAILTVCCMIFALSLPIAYYAARYGVDIDLLTRGAGFGYLGSTITSLIYAGFTFLFFALEAAIMGQAITMYSGMPLSLAYLLSSVAIIPLVIYGVTAINRLQAWTQPLWLILLVLPYLCIAWQRPETFTDFSTFTGRQHDGSFAWAAFGAACGVALSLVAQIGEQVDYLRFLPEKHARNRLRWWLAVVMAGPGWVVLGGLKIFGGALLAFLALQHELPWAQAVEPTHLYQVAFGYVFDSPGLVLAATVLFVVLSQIKINVTNAYAGSLAWSNFFSRVTRSHPGRVVWLIFNVLIALILLEVGIFTAIESVLGFYANLAAAWIGALAADLVINKPLGLSPRGIEFKRGHLYDINPVGIGALVLAGGAALAAYAGLFGPAARAAAPAIALGGAFVSAIVIALLTRGRFYLARKPVSREMLASNREGHAICVLCHNNFELDDMAMCPAYAGTICSLCCSLDMRCNDICRPEAHFSSQRRALLLRLLPKSVFPGLYTRLSFYVLVLGALSLVLAGVLVTVYAQVAPLLVDDDTDALFDIFVRTFLLLSALTAMLSWWVVLTREARAVAQEETSRQTELLMHEIRAHEKTDAELQRAKSEAEAANRAKSRYVSSLSHELRTPLNNVLGYTQLLRRDERFDAVQRDRLDIIQRSGEHLLALVDGLLDIARIEAGRLSLEVGEIDMQGLMNQLDAMFAPQAEDRGLDFRIEWHSRIPERVRGDEQRLRQVLINLLSNAIRFTSEGSVRLRIAYAWEVATFDVIDTGPGIDPSRLEEIFLPFERLDVPSSADTAGTGLGLTICQLLAQLMGGELTVSPGAGGIGSHFKLRVFLARVMPVPLHAGTTPNVIDMPAPQRRALVVDDMPDQRALLGDVLKPQGFEVASCADGPSALRFLAAERVDLIVMDVGMPAMDGFEVSRLIRARCLSDAPILVVSANAYGEDVARSEAVGCDAYLSKPINLELLEEKLATLLQHAPQAHPRARVEASAGPAAMMASDAPPLPRSEPAASANAAGLRARLQAAADAGAVAGIEAVLGEIETACPTKGEIIKEMRTAARRFDFDHLVRIAWKLDAPPMPIARREDDDA